jgi:hypothetical protein
MPHYPLPTNKKKGEFNSLGNLNYMYQPVVFFVFFFFFLVFFVIYLIFWDDGIIIIWSLDFPLNYFACMVIYFLFTHTGLRFWVFRCSWDFGRGVLESDLWVSVFWGVNNFVCITCDLQCSAVLLGLTLVGFCCCWSLWSGWGIRVWFSFNKNIWRWVSWGETRVIDRYV